ncbi:RHS repeat-associated core domain-containing protein [Iodobacter fluviatilis]|uniref:Cell wall-associated polypeptide CWBP200 n=1 Tax=Iodobacter fluviatilis TaxID=537 RepID=A0A7G3G8H3_9NEIS|nr:RHS repeat-associated core domain-containing protein [Iodobacter fluviatilis]QBC43323.1 hypothetical protein C1H71_07065 [Iodobacter fluviatilis]
MLGEYQADGKPVQETIWLGDTPVAVLSTAGASANISYIWADHLGTPRQITDPASKQILWRWDGEPFGNSLADEDPSKTGKKFSYNLRFPGQYFDKETGKHYNYFRDYDPATGRYIESDPIGLAGGINTYGYVGGNPIVRIDPMGLATLTLTGGGSLVVVGGGEGSIGVYTSNNPVDFGIVISGGAGGGGNVGLSGQVGYIPGPLSNVSGTTQNTNMSWVIGSGTLMRDPITGKVVGGTIGLAGRLGLSETVSKTGTYGLRGLFDHIFSKFLP